MTTPTIGKHQRYQNAAHRLNRDAYEQQAAERKVKQFHPCPKSLVLIAACRDLSQPASVVEQEAVYTHCTCHSGLTVDQLLDMEFEDWTQAERKQGNLTDFAEGPIRFPTETGENNA